MKITRNKLVNWQKVKHTENYEGYDLLGSVGQDTRFALIFKSFTFAGYYAIHFSYIGETMYYKTEDEAKAKAEVLALKHILGI